MNNRPIGVFDSGLGGLTVVKALKKILPNERILYLKNPFQYKSLCSEVVKERVRAADNRAAHTQHKQGAKTPKVDTEEQKYNPNIRIHLLID